MKKNNNYTPPAFEKPSFMLDAEYTELLTFAQKISKNAQPIAPTHVFRESARERLMANIFSHRMPGWNTVYDFFCNFRFSGVAIAALFLVLVSLFSFTTRPFTTSAREFNILHTNGEVWLERGTEKISAIDGTRLFAGDRITTMDDSTAEIHFLDYSVTRLSSNTTVTLSDMPNSPLELNSTPTKLYISEGRAWTKSLKSIEDDEFTVDTPHGTIKANQASFDISVQPSTTEVIVQKNLAEISANPAPDQNTVTTQETNNGSLLPAQTTATQSEKVILTATSENGSDTTITVKKSRPTPDDTWISENLTADEAHTQAINEEIKQELTATTGALPGEALYPIKQISEAVRTTLTFDAESRLSVKAEIAQTRLAEAALLLEEGHTTEATQAIESFYLTLDEIESSLQSEDENTVKELHTKINEIIAQSGTKLASIEASSPAQTAKEVAEEARITLAENPLDKTTAQLNQASQRLLEANELIDTQNYQLAYSKISSYLTASSNIQSSYDQLSIEDKRTIQEQIADKKTKELSLISTLQDKLRATDESDLIQAVQDSQAAATTVLNEASRTVKDSDSDTAPAIQVSSQPTTENTLLEGTATSITPAE